MYGGGTIAATGVGMSIFGVEVSLSLLAAIVVLLIVVGGLAYRYKNRASRYGS